MNSPIQTMALLLVGVTLTIGCDGKPQMSVADSFQAARSEVHAGSFDAALQKLTQFEKANPNSTFASRTAFLKAKCLLGKEDLQSAIEGFESVIDRYPDSLESKKSRFKLAMIDILEEKPDSAKQRLSAIVAAGNNPFMPESKAWLKKLP